MWGFVWGWTWDWGPNVPCPAVVRCLEPVVERLGGVGVGEALGGLVQEGASGHGACLQGEGWM